MKVIDLGAYYYVDYEDQGPLWAKVLVILVGIALAAFLCRVAYCVATSRIWEVAYVL